MANTTFSCAKDTGFPYFCISGFHCALLVYLQRRRQACARGGNRHGEAASCISTRRQYTESMQKQNRQSQAPTDPQNCRNKLAPVQAPAINCKSGLLSPVPDKRSPHQRRRHQPRGPPLLPAGRVRPAPFISSFWHQFSHLCFLQAPSSCEACSGQDGRC